MLLVGSWSINDQFVTVRHSHESHDPLGSGHIVSFFRLGGGKRIPSRCHETRPTTDNSTRRRPLCQAFGPGFGQSVNFVTCVVFVNFVTMEETQSIVHNHCAAMCSEFDVRGPWISAAVQVHVPIAKKQKQFVCIHWPVNMHTSSKEVSSSSMVCTTKARRIRSHANL